MLESHVRRRSRESSEEGRAFERLIKRTLLRETSSKRVVDFELQFLRWSFSVWSSKLKVEYAKKLLLMNFFEEVPLRKETSSKENLFGREPFGRPLETAAPFRTSQSFGLLESGVCIQRSVRPEHQTQSDSDCVLWKECSQVGWGCSWGCERCSPHKQSTVGIFPFHEHRPNDSGW